MSILLITRYPQRALSLLQLLTHQTTSGCVVTFPMFIFTHIVYCFIPLISFATSPPWKNVWNMSIVCHIVLTAIVKLAKLVPLAILWLPPLKNKSINAFWTNDSVMHGITVALTRQQQQQREEEDEKQTNDKNKQKLHFFSTFHSFTKVQLTF